MTVFIWIFFVNGVVNIFLDEAIAYFHDELSVEIGEIVVSQKSSDA